MCVSIKLLSHVFQNLKMLKIGENNNKNDLLVLPSFDIYKG